MHVVEIRMVARFLIEHSSPNRDLLIASTARELEANTYGDLSGGIGTEVKYGRMGDRSGR